MKRTAILVATAAMAVGCAATDRETVYQVSTLQALMVGQYDGPWTVGEIRAHGDLGLGTFNALDGEMVVLDGVVYQVRVDGSVHAMDDAVGVPFANVTFFDADESVPLPAGMAMDAFQTWMDQRLPGENLPYAFRIDGVFRHVKTRSVPAQTKPYPPLAQAVRGQRFFEFEDVHGTVLGFRFPPYLEKVNVSGYHLHFLTADRTGGGHLLDFAVETATANVDTTPAIRLVLPTDQAFVAGPLTVDDKDVHAVETAPGR